MLNHIRADESLQVLVFICLPLTVLLVGFLVYAVLKPSRTLAIFPNFSVRIEIVGREEAYIYYCALGDKVEFPATLGRKNWIHVRVPKDLRIEDSPNVVQHLAMGLEKLGYQYLIFRSNSTRDIPEGERNAAISELHAMGVRIVNSESATRVQQAVISNLPRASGDQTRATISKIQALMRQARGVRENIEVLARSNGREG